MKYPAKVHRNSRDNKLGKIRVNRFKITNSNPLRKLLKGKNTPEKGTRIRERQNLPKK